MQMLKGEYGSRLSHSLNGFVYSFSFSRQDRNYAGMFATNKYFGSPCRFESKQHSRWLLFAQYHVDVRPIQFPGSITCMYEADELHVFDRAK